MIIDYKQTIEEQLKYKKDNFLIAFFKQYNDIFLNIPIPRVMFFNDYDDCGYCYHEYKKSIRLRLYFESDDNIEREVNIDLEHNKFLIILTNNNLSTNDDDWITFPYDEMPLHQIREILPQWIKEVK